MARLKQRSTGKIIAGGIRNQAHGEHIAQEANVDISDIEVVFDLQEVQGLRRSEYRVHSDYLFFDYMAAVAEFGDASAEAASAKSTWLNTRKQVKANLPKPT